MALLCAKAPTATHSSTSASIHDAARRYIMRFSHANSSCSSRSDPALQHAGGGSIVHGHGQSADLRVPCRTHARRIPRLLFGHPPVFPRIVGCPAFLVRSLEE